MTELQRLLMNAYRNQDSMDAIHKAMQDRQLDLKAAGAMGMTAPMSYGQMSLEEMIARASGQETDKSIIGGVKRIMDVDPNEVGGSIGIMDILREF